MSLICKGVLIGFCLLYLLALAAVAVGTFGLFGAERDPLSGLYPLPLGWPWNRAIDGLPEWSWAWLSLAAPALNLAVLYLLCRVLRRRRKGKPP